MLLSVCLYSCLSCPALKVHLFCAALYCHVWPVWLYHIVQHYLINGKISGKKIIESKICVLISSTAFVWNIYQFMENSAQVLIRLEISRHISEKSLKVSNSIKIRPARAKFFHADHREKEMNGRTDDQTYMTKFTLTFRNFANTPLKTLYQLQWLFATEWYERLCVCVLTHAENWKPSGRHILNCVLLYLKEAPEKKKGEKSLEIPVYSAAIQNCSTQ